MFNLDNIELDFDEDFSSNIFSKKVPSEGKGSTEKEKPKPNQNFCKSNVVKSNNQLNEHPKQEKVNSSSDFLNFPFPGENSLKRPHKEVEKPQKKRLSHEGLLQRKFPGPAGLLPDKPFKEISEVPLLLEKEFEEEEETEEKEKTVIYSQCSGSVFLGSGYQKLVNDFNLNESNSPLNRYTVEWVKKTALNKGLQGRKIPFLGLVVHAVNHSMPDPVLVLRDPTGEISGSLHREVWAEMGGKLKTGIALAVRQVGVLITGVIRRQIYLNITMNNILAIYSPSENESEVETTTVNGASKSELLKSVADWSASTRAPPAHTPPPPPPPSFPFTTIDGPKPPPARCNETKNVKSKETEVFNDLGIVFSDSDFSDEIGIPRSDRDRSANGRTSNQMLSPAESQIFEEVLSGINLDEFEM